MEQKNVTFLLALSFIRRRCCKCWMLGKRGNIHHILRSCANFTNFSIKVMTFSFNNWPTHSPPPYLHPCILKIQLQIISERQKTFPNGLSATFFLNSYEKLELNIFLFICKGPLPCHIGRLELLIQYLFHPHAAKSM